MTQQSDHAEQSRAEPAGWRRALRTARRPLRHLAVLLILALIVEYLVIPELVGASKDLYLLGRVNIGWMILGVALEGLSLFCYALLNRVLLTPEHRPSISRLFRIDLSAAAVAHVIPAGTVGSAGIGFQLFTAEGVPGTEVGVMMATKGMASTLILNILLWVALVISIPLSGFRPVYASVALVGAVILALLAVLVLGVTRGEKRAAQILRAIGERIPGVGGERLERIALQLTASIRSLGTNRRILVQVVVWASLNWLLDAACLWTFIAAFGHFTNPVGLFAAYGVANVLGAIPITPGGLGIIDTVTPVLLISFGLTRSVATLGVLGWRLVNFWLPIPVGAASYLSLKVPRHTDWRTMRRALSDLTARGSRNGSEPRDGGEHAEGQRAGSRLPAAGSPHTDSEDSRR